MKNMMIAILLTYIYYTDFCVVKMPVVVPVMILILWAMIAEIEDFFKEYGRSVRRGQRLAHRIRRMNRKEVNDETDGNVTCCYGFCADDPGI